MRRSRPASTALDASVGGIGGCPFAPAATGNIPSEDLCYMLDRMGIDTGYSAAALIEISTWLQGQLGHDVPAMLGAPACFRAWSGPPDGLTFSRRTNIIRNAEKSACPTGLASMSVAPSRTCC